MIWCCGCATHQVQFAAQSPGPTDYVWRDTVKSGETACVFTSGPGYVPVGPTENQDLARGDQTYYGWHPALTVMFPTDKYFGWVWPIVQRATTPQQAIFYLRSEGLTVSGTTK
jgi:hypothetical protein